MQCAKDNKNGQSRCKHSLNWRIDHEVHLQTSQLSANSYSRCSLGWSVSWAHKGIIVDRQFSLVPRIPPAESLGKVLDSNTGHQEPVKSDSTRYRASTIFRRGCCDTPSHERVNAHPDGFV